jgi:putative transposase
MSVARLSRAFNEARSTVGRWVGPSRPPSPSPRGCPVSGTEDVIAEVRELCLMDRHRTFGHRRIHALLKQRGRTINRKTVLKIMREEKLTQPKVWRRPQRPKRVEKMRPQGPNLGWEIDMTSFQLADMTTLFLVVVIDCYSRKIVGWTLSGRCRASEWTSAVRMALESAGLTDKEKTVGLLVRSDNGSQPCSKKFVEFLGQHGVRGQYTGYDAPDDNAFVERVIRTIKEEEVWPNSWETLWEAHESMDSYIRYYNEQRPHSAIGYQTPAQAAAQTVTLNAA